MSSRASLQAAERALQAGAPGQAVKLVRPLFQAADLQVRGVALRIAAQGLHALDQTSVALTALQGALHLQPDAPAAWRVAAEIFTALGDDAQAERSVRMLVRLKPGDLQAWVALCELRLRRDDLAGAVEALSEAILRAPQRVDLVQRRLELLLDLGALGTLVRFVGEAVTRFPAHPELRVLAAQTCFHCSDMPGAIAHVDAALDADPGHVGARTTRASYRLMGRDYAGAREDADIVLSRFPSEPAARTVRARVSLALGDPAAACADLDCALARTQGVSDEVQGSALLRRGAAREALKDHAGALEDYVEGQRLMSTVRRFRLVDGDGYLAGVQRRYDALAAGAPLVSAAASWPAEVTPDVPLGTVPPVFVFGFPRSGTTLLERILGGHPQLVPTDESNLFGHVVAMVNRRFDRRAAHELTDAEVLVLRGIFERRARKFGADPDRGLRVIDKLPLNFVYVALMRRVFPDAPMLMVARDPRDCVWSSFVQAFSPNAAMVHTTSLEGTASLYHQTMRVWLRAKQTLPGLDATEVRYEALVSDDLEASARGLCAATGLPWDPAMLDYRSSLSGQVVRTPSSVAVSRPMTRSRVARWRNFRVAMEPILPVLSPYVEHFGYPPDGACVGS